MDSEVNVPLGSIILVPGVKSSYRNGWTQLRKYFLELFLIGIITFLLGELFNIASLISMVSSSGWSSYITQANEPLTIWDVLGLVYSILFVSALGYGVSFAYLKAARGDGLEVKDMFEAFKNYWNAVLATLLVGGIVLIGFVLLIIPGVVFSLKLSFAPYLVVDRKMKAVEAVKESWRMTGGHTWQIFLIGLLGIPIMIGGLFALLVGIIPATMWVSLAGASLYHSISLMHDKTASQAAT